MSTVLPAASENKMLTCRTKLHIRHEQKPFHDTLSSKATSEDQSKLMQ